MNGIIVLNKEYGMTSRDCVNKLTHILHTKKIGHTGTLDPIATGVLVCTIGKYTKLGESLVATKKEYIAKMIIGYETDTLDVTGKVINEGKNNFNNEDIINAINSFKGKYLQTVPAYSSVKINGKKLYEYARENIEVNLPSRMVNIYNIEIINIDNNVVTFKCLVSKGTYIRSLIRDIGYKLNTYATMMELQRTKQGIFNIESSYKINDIENNNYKLLLLEDVLDLEIINCDDNLYKQINNGVKQYNIYNKEYVLFKYNNDDISLYRLIDNEYRMFLKLN